MAKRKLHAVDESHHCPRETSDISNSQAKRRWKFDSKAFLTNKHVQASNLCDTCASIDFPAIYRAIQKIQSPRSKGLKGIPLLDLGTLEASKAKSCQLCQMFIAMISTQEPRASKWTYHLRGYDSLSIYKFSAGEGRIKQALSVVMALIPGPPLKQLARPENPFEYGLITPIGWPASIGDQPKKYLYQARRVHPNHINYRLLRQYIDHCQEHHRQCREPQKARALNLKVIDCWMTPKPVVFLEANAKYLALSYVWGSTTQNLADVAMPTPGFLPKKVPLTVEDAMKVVRCLGYRYLWIDKYCINQTNLQEKHDQIAMVDRIYEYAELTIVALGPNAEEGLPGVSKVPRSPQPCTEIQFATLASTLPRLSTILPKSCWVGRGWTYQEMVISRRCLFFTKDQVHFACKGGVFCESEEKSLVQSPNLDALRTTKLDSTLCKAQSVTTDWNGLAESYRQHLWEYTSRVLSYQSDILNAFRGILARTDMPTYWGVLILSDWPCSNRDLNAGFAYGLL